ncbi:hypothetical protein DC31_00640 [Microbacterium sp. CH12i]|uniref:DUF6412 domain-containing protein n=1 Tax=Microbacterium sp. CH12i TaxID=1479651 RepID=UPI000461BEDE|nr:DUF6412 domain-containing protein [Microbacterium sp. CH12i]KDA06999.1 hypothetical protein DC31_00640 [Microbacterium sp. CH12i]
MSEWFEQMLSILLAALGLVSVPDVMSFGVAIAIVAVALLTLTIVLSTLPAGSSSAPHPRRAIGRSVLLSQSDPGASGHPRPRRRESCAPCNRPFVTGTRLFADLPATL